MVWSSNFRSKRRIKPKCQTWKTSFLRWRESPRIWKSKEEFICCNKPKTKCRVSSWPKFNRYSIWKRSCWRIIIWWMPHQYVLWRWMRRPLTLWCPLTKPSLSWSTRSPIPNSPLRSMRWPMKRSYTIWQDKKQISLLVNSVKEAQSKVQTYRNKIKSCPT